MIRDEELIRIIKYAEGLGLRVIEKPYVPRSLDAASWSSDGTEIIIYTKPNKSKVQCILDLIHEVSHHLLFLDLGKKIPQGLLTAVDYSEMTSKITPKRYRKILYDFEVNSSAYHLYVYNSIGLKFPIYKLHVERDLSNWIYYTYYMTGKFPIRKAISAKEQELIKEYKNETSN